MRHGLYVTIVCYVLLAIVVDHGTRLVPFFVVLERDRLKALVDYGIIESVISCKTAEATWTDLVHSFEGPSDTKENRIIDMKLYQPEPKIQKDYKTEYKKMKGKLALLEASPSTSQNPKTSQSKNKGLVVKTFDWGEEEVSNDE
ncbi:hypothetical protein Tco_0168279 [Tanacetum coccineum]